MQIDRLELEGFRNYARQAADFDPRCNVICGENAQGKTNLLEALVYLSCGRSPRAREILLPLPIPRVKPIACIIAMMEKLTPTAPDALVFSWLTKKVSAIL